jgi:ABC-type Fe3+/spermidine/putrescine transport system ATPase subunit
METFKFTSAGGNVEIILTHDEKNARITIKDDGENIPENKLETIFRRFYQNPSNSNDTLPGTGIGLDLTRSLVELHHGTIIARNNQNGEKGCKFIVTLPLGCAHLSPEELTDENNDDCHPLKVQSDNTIPERPGLNKEELFNKLSTRKRQTIVIVEDDEDIRNYLRFKTKKDFYAVHDANLEIAPGEFVTLLGPSGCGKTTILRMIAGFESPDEGQIYLGGEPINDLTPNKRDTAMVFQSYALLPHYNIFDNVAYGLKIRKLPADEIRDKVMRILGMVGLEGMEDRMTNQLSGGQQQRVALARALVIEPSVLLFDEPLSNLDAKLRVEMRTEVRRIQQEAGITAVYVTHDQSEAMAIADRIIVMKRGVIDQVGDPHAVYYRPVDEFVADFIGESNFLRGKLAEKEGRHRRRDHRGAQRGG